MGAPTIGPDPPCVAAAALTALVAGRARSALLTVVLGMLAWWGLQTRLGEPHYNLGDCADHADRRTNYRKPGHAA
ncbi:MAG: hypothetical protein IPK44_26110 [Candidatus Accumulibacter sp.]|nr:hypothetical protein [Accumulibacter sp.]